MTDGPIAASSVYSVVNAAPVASLEPAEPPVSSEDPGLRIGSTDRLSAAHFFAKQRENALRRGGQSQGLPVWWENLTVSVHRSPVHVAPTLGQTCLDGLGVSLYKWLWASYRRVSGHHPDVRYILQNNSGLLNRGEMLLVLGRPESGVSTFLRAIACEWDAFDKVSGLLDYSSLKPKDIRSKMRGTVCYLPEDDLHFAQISVRSALMTALRCKTPSTRDIDDREAWQTSQLGALASMLGVSPTLSTPVGNEALRGISGGERKRVSIAELLTTRASVLCLDNATSGLDSSTASASVSLLRDMARAGDRTVIAGLRQVGNTVFEQFDKVLVLHYGRQVYFGPVKEAQAYFEALGFESIAGQTIADFVCACTDPKTRRIKKGYEIGIPRSADDFARAFLASSTYVSLQEELKGRTYENHAAKSDANAFRKALRAEKDSLTPKRSIFTVSFFHQVGILVTRQYDLIKADLYPYVTKTVVNVLLSVLVGTLFFQLPVTTDSAFLRGSVILLALLFNGYVQLSELGNTLVGRPIVRRQGQFAFYSPSALAMARVISDLPLIAIQVTIFATITYLLTGLQRSIERFSVYLLFVYVMALNLTTVFRTFAAFSPSINEALRYCGLALNIFVVYGGFFIPAPTMKPWLRWIHGYLDPVSQAYEAVLSNEFRGLKLRCSTDAIVPRGPAYQDQRFQTCAFAGSTPGSLLVDGEDYVKLAFDFDYHHIWRNLLILLIQALAFLTIGVLSTEYLHFAPAGSHRLFIGADATSKHIERMHSRADLEARMVHSTEEGSDASSELTVKVTSKPTEERGSTLTWRDLNVSVMLSKECRTLLHDINGFIRPGQVTALMGPSGAGKTTLLNALAGRGNNSHMDGTVHYDGREASKHVFRHTGFVEQLDLHDDFATVREALEFSALLRQDVDIPRQEKLAYVEEVLDLLELKDLQHAVVGTTRAGLALEQRKRLTIAVELVSRPQILFLDEPTSGLDSQSAHQIVLCMKRLAQTGIPILATIHQPSAEVFSCFDQLLLLECGGRQAYFGRREEAINYFQGFTAQMTSGANPAEYLLDVLGAGSSSLFAASVKEKPSAHWSASSEAMYLSQEILQLDESRQESPSTIADKEAGASVTDQVSLLYQRMSRNFYRDTSFSYSKVFTTVAVAMVVGLSFFQQGDSIAGLQNKTFAVFLLLFIPPVFMNALIQKVYVLRSLYLQREQPANIYGLPAFCTALLLADLPYALGCGMLYMAIFYPLVGFPGSVATVGFVFLMVEVFFIFQYTLALALTAITQSAGVVANLLPFFLVAMEAFNGSLIPYRKIPSYWRWLYWVSPFQWYIKGVLGTVLHDAQIRCSAAELVSIPCPPDQSCSTYMAPYLASHAGMLLEERGLCRYCRLTTGDEYLATLNIRYNDRWLALVIMLFYTLTNVALFYLLSLTPRPSRLFTRRRTIAL